MVRDDEVDITVVVEIDGVDVGRFIATRDGRPQGLEPPTCHSDQQRHSIVPSVGHHDITPAIIIQIGSRNRPRAVTHVIGTEARRAWGSVRTS
jgi:hypothetical protein